MKKKGMLAKQAGFRKLTETAVSGLHHLAYSLTLDPEEEIRAALEEEVSDGEPRSLEGMVKEAGDDGLDAAVAEAPVIYHDNRASYRSDAVELPENYKDSGYRSADDDDDYVEVRYAFENAEQKAAGAYETQIEEQVFNNALGLHRWQSYASADEMERVENYKTSLGYAKRFLLYAMKALTF